MVIDGHTISVPSITNGHPSLYHFPYLSHYSDAVGQWYRSVVGKCLNILGTPGNSDYFEAEHAEKIGDTCREDAYIECIYINI